MGFWAGRRVLITGGAGFMGSHLARHLVGRGCALVRCVDDMSRGRLAHLVPVLSSVELVDGDLRNPTVCRRVAEDIEVVFHLAARVGGIGYYLERPGEVLLDNVTIDANMLRAALQAGVERYFYASSAHVYPGRLQRTPDAPALREEDAEPAAPDLAYGWAKLLGERQIRAVIAEGRPLIAAIARLIGAYGENQDIDLATGSVIPVFCRRALEYPAHGPFVVWGTGRETRSYCYVGDVVEGIRRMVAKGTAPGLVGPLNLGRDGRVTIGEIAETVVRLAGKEIAITYDPSRPTVVWGQACDCTRAAAELDGWRAPTTLEEGLGRVLDDVARRLDRPARRSA
jgi:GDP-D-mannose 3',5'-epimerase